MALQSYRSNIFLAFYCEFLKRFGPSRQQSLTDVSVQVDHARQHSHHSTPAPRPTHTPQKYSRQTQFCRIPLASSATGTYTYIPSRRSAKSHGLGIRRPLRLFARTLHRHRCCYRPTMSPMRKPTVAILACCLVFGILLGLTGVSKKAPAAYNDASAQGLRGGSEVRAH